MVRIDLEVSFHKRTYSIRSITDSAYRSQSVRAVSVKLINGARASPHKRL